MKNKYQSYVITLGEILVEELKEAKFQRDKSTNTESESFATGYLYGINRAIDLMHQQASIYEISEDEILSEKIDLTKYF